MRQAESNMPTKENVLVILHQDILDGGHSIRLSISGDSMSPILRDGDVVEVQPATPDQLRKGDLILFKTEEGFLILHRYIRSQAWFSQVWLLTKGDASLGFDRPVSPQQVLGRVVQIIRQGRVLSLEGKKARLVNYVLAKISPYRPIISRVYRSFKLEKQIR